MTDFDGLSEIIPVKLPNGQIIQVEALRLGGPEKVAAGGFPDFSAVAAQIEGIAEALRETLVRAKPTKATVEIGVAIALEAGQLTALIAKGSANANLKISLEWSDGKD